jgi:hypothetical protein
MEFRALILSGISMIGILAFSRLTYADQVTCKAESVTVDRCRVTEPNIKQPATESPGVRFRPGDAVTVSAGGCVQTGGRDKTWKRYVVP